MYKTIERFRDLEDRHLYEAGDAFPHDGRTVEPGRINALLTGQNLARKALIVEIQEETNQTPNGSVETPEAPKRTTRSRKKA